MSLRELIINDIVTSTEHDPNRYERYREIFIRDMNPSWSEKQIRTLGKTFKITASLLEAMTDAELFATYQSFWWQKAKQR
jgi:hypothetical protein